MLREDHGRVAILFSCLPEPVSSTIEERRYIIFSPGIGEKNMYIRIKSALRKMEGVRRYRTVERSLLFFIENKRYLIP